MYVALSCYDMVEIKTIGHLYVQYCDALFDTALKYPRYFYYYYRCYLYLFSNAQI